MAEFDKNGKDGIAEMLERAFGGRVVCLEVSIELPLGATNANDGGVPFSAEAQMREVLRTVMDTVMFDVAAAERGAFPPGHA